MYCRCGGLQAAAAGVSAGPALQRRSLSPSSPCPSRPVARAAEWPSRSQSTRAVPAQADPPACSPGLQTRKRRHTRGTRRPPRPCLLCLWCRAAWPSAHWAPVRHSSTTRSLPRRRRRLQRWPRHLLRRSPPTSLASVPSHQLSVRPLLWLPAAAETASLCLPPSPRPWCHRLSDKIRRRLHLLGQVW